jgi:CelD/BcsL family acetyltransferase involved in cellulose biosynthesis
VVRPDEVLQLGQIDDARRAAWQDLCVRTGAGYFTGPVWATAWHETFGRGEPTQVAWWGTEHQADAIAAMVRVREPLLPGGARPAIPAWHNLGSGPGGADHLGFPSVPSRRTDAVGWARSLPGSVRLDHLDEPWAADLGPADRLARTRTYAVRIDQEARPGSKKLWKHIVRSRRQLVERGVDFQVHLGSQLDRALLTQLFSLHGIRSDRVGRRTTFTADRLDFHHRLALHSTPVHCSFLVAARLDGALVGALYGFADPTRLHYYQSGWDPSFEKASLGSVLIGEAIDLASARAATTFDFLRGDEPYKLRFGASVHDDVSALIARGVSGVALRARDELAERVARRRVSRDGEPAATGSGARTGPSAPPR